MASPCGPQEVEVYPVHEHAVQDLEDWLNEEATDLSALVDWATPPSPHMPCASRPARTIASALMR